MKLDDLMREATDDTHVDLPALTRTASARGRTVRRRRRIASSVAGLATVSACVVGVSVLAPRTQPVREASPAASGSAAPSTGSTPATTEVAPLPDAPIDGRSTAALLDAMVTELADGATSDHAGQGGPGPDTYGRLTFTPTGRPGGGEVGVNVQDLSILDGEPRRCQGFMQQCAVRLLPRGEVLLSYRDTPDGAGDVRLVVERMVPAQDLRVVVSATNGFDLGANQWDITGPGAVLTAEQLRTIALDVRWGTDLPGEYAEAGAALAPYDDLDADWGASIDGAPPAPTAAPTS